MSVLRVDASGYLLSPGGCKLARLARDGDALLFYDKRSKQEYRLSFSELREFSVSFGLSIDEFAGRFPSVVDDRIERDTIEFRDKKGDLVGKIFNLAP